MSLGSTDSEAAMSEELTITIPSELAQKLDSTGRELLVEILERGLRELKIERVLDRYSRGGMSFGAAAHQAELPGPRPRLWRQASHYGDFRSREDHQARRNRRWHSRRNPRNRERSPALDMRPSRHSAVVHRTHVHSRGPVYNPVDQP